jgi:hypothetical protein
MKHASTISILILAVWFAAISDAANYRLHHDPFARPAAAVKKPSSRVYNIGPDIELRGVIFDGNSSLANISGSIVGLHEKVSGYTLTGIERDRVTLKRNGNTTILTVNDDE